MVKKSRAPRGFKQLKSDPEGLFTPKSSSEKFADFLIGTGKKLGMGITTSSKKARTSLRGVVKKEVKKFKSKRKFESNIRARENKRFIKQKIRLENKMKLKKLERELKNKVSSGTNPFGNLMGSNSFMRMQESSLRELGFPSNKKRKK